MIGLLLGAHDAQLQLARRASNAPLGKDQQQGLAVADHVDDLMLPEYP